jgi:hypothetical protein
MADVNLEAANPMRFAVYIIYAERLKIIEQLDDESADEAIDNPRHIYTQSVVVNLDDESGVYCV